MSNPPRARSTERRPMKRAVDWLDGTLDVQHRLDRGLKNGLNARAFAGRILNRENIGKTSDELVALWDAEHPDDPVED